MTLPTPNLDDLRFQRDLVDEARKRIVHYCPEWTEYNLSDPGITLIELFAWMTELMVYRLNRVPEKNYIKFLELLGMKLEPASAARTELTFWLSAGLPIAPNDPQTVVVPKGFEVRADAGIDQITFTTDREKSIVPPLLAHVRSDREFNRNFVTRMGVETFLPFDPSNPREGDAFFLGFDPKNDISGHILSIAIQSEPTEAVGIRREDPPWAWEYLNEEGAWVELSLSTLDGEKDTTGGLNNEVGALTLYLPTNLAPGLLYGLNAYWIRCRVRQRSPFQGMYTESPRVKMIEVFSVGASMTAVNSVSVSAETVGVSSGEPGQRFELSRSPVLRLGDGEHVEVEETRGGQDIFMPWIEVDEFSRSSRYDRHFVLDHASGNIVFGPSVRGADGVIQQFGRVPESGRRIRISGYRHGGGVNGNLPVGSLTTMTMPLAFVSRVSNRARAIGGRDQETLDELKLRSQRELQAQHRAVSASDFEQFALSSTRGVARARCLPRLGEQGASGAVNLVIVPAVADAIRAGDLYALHTTEKLREDIRAYLDKSRLMTTVLRVSEPRYIGVQVKATVIGQDHVNPAIVESAIQDELIRFLTPLALDERAPMIIGEEKWEGWRFGKDLFKAEIVSLIQRVPTVKYVVDVDLLTREVKPIEEKREMDEDETKELTAVDRVLEVPDDSLVCSLRHFIEVVTENDLYLKAAR